jgi:hypothetical protein
MNRSILIVICDFLLVSLLAFSAVEINQVTDQSVERSTTQLQILTNQAPPEVGKDLTAVMRLALDDEKKSRDLLMGELDRARQTAAERERQVRTTQQELEARDQQARQLSQDLQVRQQEAQRLAQEQSTLRGQYQVAQTNLQALTERLTTTVADAQSSREKLAAVEAELKKRAQEAASMQAQMAALASSNQAVLAESQKLAGQVQLAQVEKRHAQEQAEKMAEQVKVEREEKARLAEGVKTLATRSEALAQEVRENRPLASNTIFSEVATNRVRARFAALKSALIDTNRRRETDTVIVTDGTNYMAICHVGDTPLTLMTPSTQWDSLTGTLARGVAQATVRSIAFHQRDPRLVMVPLTAAEVKQLGSKVYRMSADPARFQDAVLIGTRDAYYGECRFQIDLTTPEYLKLDNSFLRGLMGKFNPSRGDLVFSRTGDLVGVMVNSSYCFLLQNFEVGAVLRFGNDVAGQDPAGLLSLLGSQVFALPVKLQ